MNKVIKKLNRCYCIAFALMPIVMTVGMAMAQTVTAQRTLLMVGDSLSAEYGLPRGTGWVALLEKRLRAEQIPATIVNASISGETTSGGRTRLPALLDKHHPHLVIIELGANDALRGLPLAMTQDNLTAMTQAAKKTGAKVLLLGMQVPPNYGHDYSQRFANMFADVSQSCKVRLVPFFLQGIADVPDSLRWFQSDRIHPTQAAQPKMLDNVWPVLKSEWQ